MSKKGIIVGFLAIFLVLVSFKAIADISAADTSGDGLIGDEELIAYTSQWIDNAHGDVDDDMDSDVQDEFYVIELWARVMDCGAINSPGTYYLKNDVTSAGTCFTIESDDVMLDCQEYTITYATGGSGNGVYSDRDSTGIRNCTIIEGSSSGSGAHGIYFQGATNGVIQDNSITTSSYGAYAIYLYSSSNYNTITGNEVTTSGFNGYGIRAHEDSDSNSISHNKVVTSGDGGQAISIRYNSDNAEVTNNIIRTFGEYAYGIYLSSSSNNDIVSNNNIRTSGEKARGIYLSSSSNSNINANYVVVESSTEGHGMYVVSGSNGNNIKSNLVKAAVNSIYTTSENNIIYDNFFNGDPYVSAGTNEWDIYDPAYPIYEPNIIGGNIIGGNFWTNSDKTGHSDSCGDIDDPLGICDEEYMISGNNVDRAPLTSMGPSPVGCHDITIPCVEGDAYCIEIVGAACCGADGACKESVMECPCDDQSADGNAYCTQLGAACCGGLGTCETESTECPCDVSEAYKDDLYCRQLIAGGCCDFGTGKCVADITQCTCYSPGENEFCTSRGAACCAGIPSSPSLVCTSDVTKCECNPATIPPGQENEGNRYGNVYCRGLGAKCCHVQAGGHYCSYDITHCDCTVGPDPAIGDPYCQMIGGTCCEPFVYFCTDDPEPCGLPPPPPDPSV